MDTNEIHPVPQVVNETPAQMDVDDDSGSELFFRNPQIPAHHFTRKAYTPPREAIMSCTGIPSSEQVPNDATNPDQYPRPTRAHKRTSSEALGDGPASSPSPINIIGTKSVKPCVEKRRKRARQAKAQSSVTKTRLQIGLISNKIKGFVCCGNLCMKKISVVEFTYKVFEHRQNLNKYLADLQNNERGVPSFMGVQFCNTLWGTTLAYLQIPGPSLIPSNQEASENTSEHYPARSKNTKSMEARKNAFIDRLIRWTLALLQVKAPRPLDGNERLPCSTEQAYLIFLSEFMRHQDTSPPTLATFSRLWKDNTEDLSISPTPIYRQVNPDCEEAFELFKQGGLKKYSAREILCWRNANAREIDPELKTLNLKVEEACESSAESSILVIDASEQPIVRLPHIQSNNTFDRSSRIPVGAIRMAYRGATQTSATYLTYKRFSDAAENELVEALHRMLTSLKEKHALPAELHIHMLGMNRKSKNKIFLAYLECLVAWGIVQNVVLSYTPVGHCLPAAEKLLPHPEMMFRGKNIVCPSDMVQALGKYTPGHSEVNVLDNALNFRALLQGNLRVPEDITGLRHFKIQALDRPIVRNGVRNIHETRVMVKCSIQEEWKVLKTVKPESARGQHTLISEAPTLTNAPGILVLKPHQCQGFLKRFAESEHLFSTDAKAELMDLVKALEFTGFKEQSWRPDLYMDIASQGSEPVSPRLDRDLFNSNTERHESQISMEPDQENTGSKGEGVPITEARTIEVDEDEVEPLRSVEHKPMPMTAMDEGVRMERMDDEETISDDLQAPTHDFTIGNFVAILADQTDPKEPPFWIGMIRDVEKDPVSFYVRKIHLAWLEIEHEKDPFKGRYFKSKVKVGRKVTQSMDWISVDSVLLTMDKLTQSRRLRLADADYIRDAMMRTP